MRKRTFKQVVFFFFKQVDMFYSLQLRELRRFFFFFWPTAKHPPLVLKLNIQTHVFPKKNKDKL